MSKLQKNDIWTKADAAYERGQQAYLDWCREIAALYAAGTATQAEIGERYGKDQQRIGYAISTANDQRLLRFKNVYDLPKSKQAIYLLTTLPDEDFERLCRPDTTQAKILEYKRQLAAPKTVEYDLEHQARYEALREEERLKSTRMVPAPKDCRGVLEFLENYISSTTNENRIELLKVIRRLEHPDKGGSTELSAEINLIIERNDK